MFRSLSLVVVALGAALIAVYLPPPTCVPSDIDTTDSDYLAGTLLRKAATGEASHMALMMQTAGFKGPYRHDVEIEWETDRINTDSVYRIAQEQLDIMFARLPVRAVLEPGGLSRINRMARLTATVTVSLIENPP